MWTLFLKEILDCQLLNDFILLLYAQSFKELSPFFNINESQALIYEEMSETVAIQKSQIFESGITCGLV